MSILKRVAAIDEQLTIIDAKCSVTSGLPAFGGWHKKRGALLQERQRLIGLTPEQFIVLHGYEAWVAIRGQYHVGDRVSVVGEMNRRSRISAKYVNANGKMCLMLADGGIFGESEIEYDKYAANGGRCVA